MQNIGFETFKSITVACRLGMFWKVSLERLPLKQVSIAKHELNEIILLSFESTCVAYAGLNIC